MVDIVFDEVPSESPEPNKLHDDFPELTPDEKLNEVLDSQRRRIQRVERRVSHIAEEHNKDAVFHAFLIGLILGIFLTLRSNRKDDK